MAYKIQYSPETAHRYPQHKERPKLRLGKWIYFGILILAVYWIRVNGVPDIFIPGDPDITRNATQTMVADIQSGAAINDAVTAFCKTVLHGAGY